MNFVESETNNANILAISQSEIKKKHFFFFFKADSERE